MPIERAVYKASSWNVYWSVPGGGLTSSLTPVAGFSAAQLTPGGPVNFDATSSAESGGTIVSWIWDFGDGSFPLTAKSAKTSHSYVRPGTYSITLIAVDTNGNKAQTTRSIEVVVDIRPAASFALNVTDLLVDVDGSGSSDLDGQIVSYHWDFGDGASVDGVTAQHQYTFGGTYEITLIVTDNLGAIALSTKTIQAAFLPDAEFNLSANGLTVTVDATSSYDFNPIKLYTFSWGYAGSKDTSGKSPTAIHTYPVAGTYPIALTITDAIGRQNTITHEVYVTPIVVPEPPIVRFTASVTNLTVNVNAAKTTDVDSFITEYYWTFGDGAIDYGVTTSHSYVSGGTYNITLRATDNLGMRATTKHSVTVSTPLPKPIPAGPGGGGNDTGGKERLSFPYQDMNKRQVIGGSPPEGDNFDPDTSWIDHRLRGSMGGVDHNAPYGTPLYANCAGRVNTIGINYGGTGGRTLNLHLGSTGWYDQYMHLSSFAVSDGQHVKQGQLVGHSGASGDGADYFYAPHFHLHRYTPGGERVNAWHYFCHTGTSDSRNVKPGEIINTLYTGVPNLTFNRRLQWYASLNGYAYPCDGFMSIPAWKGVQRGLRNYDYNGPIDGIYGTNTRKALQRMAHQHGASGSIDGSLSTSDYKGISRRLNLL